MIILGLLCHHSGFSLFKAVNNKALQIISSELQEECQAPASNEHLLIGHKPLSAREYAANAESNYA